MMNDDDAWRAILADPDHEDHERLRALCRAFAACQSVIGGARDELRYRVAIGEAVRERDFGEAAHALAALCYLAENGWRWSPEQPEGYFGGPRRR